MKTLVFNKFKHHSNSITQDESLSSKEEKRLLRLHKRLATAIKTGKAKSFENAQQVMDYLLK